jgi:hypothetical protein
VNEYVYRDRGGRVVYAYRATAPKQLPRLDGYVLTVSDVTAQVEAEAAQRRMARRRPNYGALVDAVLDREMGDTAPILGLVAAREDARAPEPEPGDTQPSRDR